MNQAPDIITQRLSQPPQLVAVDALGAQVDEVFHNLIEGVAQKERDIARLTAERASLIDQTREWMEKTAHTSVLGIGERRPTERDSLVRQVIAEELACALRVPARTAEALVAASKTLVHDLPGTMDSLRTGVISYRHAEVVIDESWNLPASADAGAGDEIEAADARQLFESQALPHAAKLTVAKFRQKARKLRELAHPETIESRRRKAATGRAVTFTPAADGMAWLSLYLEAPKALAIYNRVTETAIGLQSAKEQRTLTQLRADVALDLLSGGESQIRPTVMVTVPVLTLLGHSDEPANLDGYGPIDTESARDLVRHAPSFTRLLTHPETGSVLSVGKNQYSVPVDMRRWLRVRDATCRFPGCNRNAKHSDIDHTTAWAHDGETRTDNLAHLCPKHHKLKHETHWAVTQGDDGALIWVSPSGHTYATEPETRMRSGTDQQHQLIHGRAASNQPKAPRPGGRSRLCG